MEDYKVTGWIQRYGSGKIDKEIINMMNREIMNKITINGTLHYLA